MASHRIRAREPDRVSAPPVARGAEALAAVRRDAAHYPGGHAAGVAHPRSEAEVAAVVRAAPRVLPIGAQSSLTGGATPAGDVVVATDRMDRILALGPGEVTVEPGVPLAVLQAALGGAGAWYPPVPTFDGACAGGVVATNAAGAATFKYGTTRDWVRRLTVVLSGGDVLDLTRGETRAHPDGYFEVSTSRGAQRVRVPSYRMPAVPKCSAGYFAAPGMDLIDLFIGSEGTLGVITSVTFAVVAPAPRTAMVWIPVDEERKAIALAGALRDAARRAWRGGSRRGGQGVAGAARGGPGSGGAGSARAGRG
ncbi:MAG: FAD-binding oxidoreductase, partial [Acidobacteria bacterium]|nr:FAD-binding oxidoreductase [Acidobacteriota bacterium]